MSKPRYFKAMVPVYVKLDYEDSDPYATLNGIFQHAEGVGNVFFDTRPMVCQKLTKRKAPKELK